VEAGGGDIYAGFRMDCRADSAGAYCREVFGRAFRYEAVDISRTDRVSVFYFNIRHYEGSG